MMVASVWVLIPMLCLFCGTFAFCVKRKHVLSTLLSLEFSVLNLYYFLICLFQIVDVMFILFFLTLAACEGALGLAILVSMVRGYGNDSFGSTSSLMC